MAVEMKREQRMLPTYEPAAPNELPFFLEKKAYQGATGRVYPIPYTDRLSNEPVEKPYDMITLSNEYIEVELLPELGGKIHGAHLEQYKHHTYVPEDYYLEALRRDPKDMRCNLAMGRSMLEKGDFAAARTYLDRAIARLKMRNDNPMDPEAIYQKARLERLCGHLDVAYQLFADASWQFGWRCACLYEMACIDCMRGDRALAVEHLTEALVTNACHLAAHTLRAYLTRNEEELHQVLALSPQDTYARYALWLLTGREVEAFIRSRPQDVIDAALDFMRAGLNTEAASVLKTCTCPNQLVACYEAYVTGGTFEASEMKLCFPNRLEDIAVLAYFPHAWQAQYLLGCLYYDRMNYAAARTAWEESARLNPDDAFTWRNLAQALYDHFGEKEEARACLEKALRLAPENARIVYELLQLYKNINMPVKDRLAFLEAHAALARQRDDCFLDMIVLYMQEGRFEKARELLLSKRFNIYEGGEGKLTRMHGWLYTMWGRQDQLNGNPDEALRWFETALVYPQNYGEGRHYSAQEANIYYYTGLLLEAQGKPDEAREAWQKAANQPHQVTEVSYFAALSLQKLGEPDKAKAIFRSMVEAGTEQQKNAHLYGYFGVGMPSPLPFELDVKPLHLAEANLLLALGYKGLGKEAESQVALQALKEIDPWNLKLCFLEKLGVL